MTFDMRIHNRPEIALEPWGYNNYVGAYFQSACFLSLSLFVSSFHLCFFKLTYSCCKFIIHSNIYPYKHESRPASRTRNFPSRMVFFLYLYCPSRHLYLFTNQWDISLRDLSSSYWRFYFPQSICLPHRHRTNPRHHPRPKTHQLNSLPHKKKITKKRNRRHLSLYFIGTRKMQAPKLYENHRLVEFLLDIFYIEDFKYETVGFPIKPLHYRMSKTIPNTTWMKSQTVRLDIRMVGTKKQHDQHIKRKDATFPTFSFVVCNSPHPPSFLLRLAFLLLNTRHGRQSLNQGKK